MPKRKIECSCPKVSANRHPLAGGFLAVALVLMTILAMPVPARAQQALSIAATVNDEMISVLDVQARILVSIQLAKLPDTMENRQRLVAQVLRGLIDEKLKLQEAKKFEIAVDKSELLRAERDFERQAGLDKGGLRRLIKQLGVDPSGFLERLESQVAWSKLVNGRYRQTANVSDREIDDHLAELERNRGKPEYLVSEIFLPARATEDREQARNLADRLIGQISDGAEFEAIARNFSQGASAATGGQLGWYAADQLPTGFAGIIQGLAPGRIAGPIETLEGYYLLKLEEKRAIDPFREEAPEPETVTLQQAHFGLPPQPAESLVSETMAKASRLGATVDSCAKLDETAKQMGASSLSGRLGTFPVNQLSRQLQSLVKPLAVSRASAPMRTADGIIVVMVCERKKPAARKADPSSRREQVRSQLIGARLNLAAEQYLRNLRRTAIVDVRL